VGKLAGRGGPRGGGRAGCGDQTPRGTWKDDLAAAAALAAVVGASIVMEQAATVLGRGYQMADIITGALVLAVVTSLPG
jgi:hypothetical protein